MDELERKAYIGIICNDKYDIRTIVLATSIEDAKAQVLEKFKDDIGTYFQEEDVQIHPFADIFNKRSF